MDDFTYIYIYYYHLIYVIPISNIFLSIGNNIQFFTVGNRIVS